MDRAGERYQNILKRLTEQLHKRLPEPQASAIGAFAGLLYRSVSVREIETVAIDELYGSILEGWYFLQQRQPGETKIRVFNPDNEANGWVSRHTVVLILTDDSPFQIDSVRMEVNRRGLTLHSIQNVIIDTERQHGQLQQLDAGGSDLGQHCESYIYLEIDRYAGPSELRQLRLSLQQVLSEVHAVTGDFDAMRLRAHKLLERLQQAPGQDEVHVELSDFVSWIIDNHFTFLGYQRLQPVRYRKRLGLRVQASSRLGLCRLEWGKNERALPQRPVEELRGELPLGERIGFVKSSQPVRVHRPVYGDYILVREWNERREMVCEHRFLGLYTSAVYFQSVRQIPVLRSKVEQVLSGSQLHPGSHDWKELFQVLETYPRDDLFQIDADELLESALGILHIHERRQIRLFVRRAAFGRYYSCLVYVPRDLYSTEFRLQVQQILTDAFDCQQVEFNTQLSESLLARTQYIIHQPASRTASHIDLVALERQVVQAARSWQDELLQALIDRHGEAQGNSLFHRFEQAFPVAYRNDFSARVAVGDIEQILLLTEARPLAMSFYRPLDGQVDQLNFKLYHFGRPVPLSQVIPVMEHLGLTVQDEHPYQVDYQQGVWLHDFGLQHSAAEQIELSAVREIFEQAFERTWLGDNLNDSYNRLVLTARLDWRQVALLRAYGAYMKQTGSTISQEAIANSLLNHVAVCRLLIELFSFRFDPSLPEPGKHQLATLQQRFQLLLDQVPGLNEDQVLRRYYALILATVRTNFYQRSIDSRATDALVLKLVPQQLADMPQPVPRYELFVHCARFEGVHLRLGHIARGGLRWSDRGEDYRTEMLGLVKAQQVKNAVIVPVGAKGGFYCRLVHDRLSKQQRLAEAQACYRQFVSAMLDITDNWEQEVLVKPPQTRCHDGDDPYLVVAADKGTAAFSDSANAIAVERRYWLGDAFASGGSQGYDHKRMGITARGGWVALERHFRELGIDIARPFRVVGIGSMAGDVFGNAMLLSDRIKLVAAFNQTHIFIDPDPDPQRSIQERRRLFGQSSAGWDHYDAGLISAGGGVFSRRAKSIAISNQVRVLLGISAERLGVNDLIKAILQAPVDLLWNGAVGTYIKSSTELDSEVGDKANDGVRINARQLQARVVIEGGNLGLTQRARVEYALAGGACNSDFIDNAAGVDCSDHEVNIKILLDLKLRQDELTLKQRNHLLRSVADKVVKRVLTNSRQQIEAISMAQAQSHERSGEYRRYIQAQEQQGGLDREQASIPTDQQLEQRFQQGKGLTRPELAVLIALMKGRLKQQLLDSELPDQPSLEPVLYDCFPDELVELCIQEVLKHPLRRELIANRVANELVNDMGISFIQRMQMTSSASTVDCVRAYLVASKIYDLPGWKDQIQALESQGVRREVQLRMLLELQRMIRRSARWLLRYQRLDVDSDYCLRVSEQLNLLIDHFGAWLQGTPAQAWKDRYYFYSQAGVPDRLARAIAGTTVLYIGLGMADLVEQGLELELVVTIYCLLGERLELFWYSRILDGLHVANHWQAGARETLRDELEQQVRRLGVSVAQYSVTGDALERFERWAAAHQLMITRWLSMLAELKSSDHQDYAIFTLASRRLADIA